MDKATPALVTAAFRYLGVYAANVRSPLHTIKSSGMPVTEADAAWQRVRSYSPMDVAACASSVFALRAQIEAAPWRDMHEGSSTLCAYSQRISPGYGGSSMFLRTPEANRLLRDLCVISEVPGIVYETFHWLCHTVDGNGVPGIVPDGFTQPARRLAVTRLSEALRHCRFPKLPFDPTKLPRD